MQPCAAPPFAADAPRADDTRWRAHDLLRVTRLSQASDAPDWVAEAMTHAPWVVVRRAQAAAGFLAVGVRGFTRAQRFGTWIDSQDVEAILRPEQLLDREPLSARATLPAWIALATLRETPGSPLRDFMWGPTGSAGFELATGAATVGAASDLDVLIRAPHRLDRLTVEALSRALEQAASRANTRVDAQLETPAGGVALAELAAAKPRVLVRANRGAQLLADPWRPS
ncbi:malonate decarboxylase holo-ACP synthase [Paraburkholderia acidisoli]|uniref:Malonate decarboxylase holo-ACP synthase n=1 Tax=Paraburkholderia acidisoli TaxID=2571748 RepID=A0A7Z2GMH9_9BURK|nr:malonate decarboxylase holo-ACP synthase [Paraburkholderia acidisoli]QGZ64129.1 malonate decarboxylase holo-ACP synthase [Paraburkholderia acidisoli]